MTEYGLSIWHILMPLIFLTPVGLLTGWVARQKRRSFLAWFVIGTLLPILALLALIAVPAKEPRDKAA